MSWILACPVDQRALRALRAFASAPEASSDALLTALRSLLAAERDARQRDTAERKIHERRCAGQRQPASGA
ncbi:hypothetical protein WME99_27925 [Sorangium sp. So ce136]|uniref:hypothetical protein n=1 Tax=Sorangium sp. So ce136 TaxID=3133284 RepID=UPI003F0883DA